MKIEGIEIEERTTQSLLQYCKIYSFLVPVYFLFAAFFAFGATVPFSPDMVGELEEMWVVIPIALAGAIAFSWVGIHLIKVVKAAKEELATRDISKEEKEAAARYAKNLLIASIIFIVVCGAAISFAIISAIDGGGTSSSSVSGEPWKDLGVSKSEYMDIYNKYKYGN